MIAYLHWCKQTEFDLLHIVLTSDVFISGSRMWAFSVQTGISLTVLLETINLGSSFTSTFQLTAAGYQFAL